MLSIKEFAARVRGYPAIEPREVLADILRRIDAIADEGRRNTARAALEDLRQRLRRCDLRGFGWPPQSGDKKGRNVDTLHADTQKLVSAVLLFDHDARRVTVLKYVLKERP